ncbi:achaete-scute homolog 5 [Canis lupus baileyi]|uniref:BHLH domain-containing protein n=1 Tax=Canis lupus familiaris TaxID=9615 RepID=A0A8C0PLG4_CANLF|eukprot:XP_005623008.1 achaete-scute homolog 5 [Canis lupus familiaris]
MHSAFCGALVERRPRAPPSRAPPPAEPPARRAPPPAEPLGRVPLLLCPGAEPRCYEAYEAYAAVLPCVPFPGALGGYDYPFEPAFIQKRNERERQRVRCVNEGYARLRGHLPGALAEKRLSKVETLRAAIRYIKYLQELLSAAPAPAPAPDGAPPASPPARRPARAPQASEGPCFSSSPFFESEASSH